LREINDFGLLQSIALVYSNTKKFCSVVKAIVALQADQIYWCQV